MNINLSNQRNFRMKISLLTLQEAMKSLNKKRNTLQIDVIGILKVRMMREIFLQKMMMMMIIQTSLIKAKAQMILS